MIRIMKGAAPQVLVDHQKEWTDDLLNAVSHYGGYDKIPTGQKKKLLVHYRHDDIKKSLFRSSHYKCAFCECRPGESGYIEVEHFAPKSIYPELTFSWDNLLPVCRKCNDDKSAFDTQTTPIINPSEEDPEKLITYNMLVMEPAPGSGDEVKAKNTIEVCNLNSPRLYKARSELLVSLTGYMDSLKKEIEDISDADTPEKKRRRITNLSNSLEIVDALLQDNSTYSGYCKWFVLQQPIYQKAKQIIANR